MFLLSIGLGLGGLVTASSERERIFKCLGNEYVSCVTVSSLIRCCSRLGNFLKGAAMAERAFPQQERVEHASGAVVGARYVDPLAKADMRLALRVALRRCECACPALETCALRSEVALRRCECACPALGSAFRSSAP
jgi:hypothetical protein